MFATAVWAISFISCGAVVTPGPVTDGGIARDGADSSTGISGPCGVVEEAATMIQVFSTIGNASPEVGGIVPDGRYELSASNFVSAQPIARPRQQLLRRSLRVSGGMWAFTSSIGDGGMDTILVELATYTAALRDNTVTLTLTCRTPALEGRTARPLVDLQATYTSTNEGRISLTVAAPNVVRQDGYRRVP